MADTTIAVTQGKSESATCHGIDFTKWPSESLIKYVSDLADDIQDNSSQIAAVAYGGVSYAGSLDSSGDPIDSTSKGMFGAIVALSESASAYLQLKDALTELLTRANVPGKGVAQ